MAAKMRAKSLAASMVVQPRSALDVENMRLVVAAKHSAYVTVQNNLRDTGTARLIEDCSNRVSTSGLFWGARKTEHGWEGRNMLGQIWEEIRYSSSKTLEFGLF